MIQALKYLFDEANEAYLQPRIQKAKIDLKLAIVTGAVVALFSLLAMVCLFLIVFLAIAQATTPTEAAVILFGFCVVMIVGALVAHRVGKAAERRTFEAKSSRRPNLSVPAALTPGFQAGRARDAAQDAFNRHKLPALAVMTVIGVLFGARPGPAIRGASKVVLGRRRETDRLSKPPRGRR